MGIVGVGYFVEFLDDGVEYLCFVDVWVDDEGGVEVDWVEFVEEVVVEGGFVVIDFVDEYDEVFVVFDFEFEVL